MGYTDETLYRLKFAERAGLIVEVAGLSTGDLLDLMDLVAKIGDKPEEVKLDADARHVVEQMMSTLAGALHSWNIEDRHGQPVSMTVAGLKTLKFPLVMDIVSAWMDAQSEVDDELGKDSTSGASSAPVPPMPMEHR